MKSLVVLLVATASVAFFVGSFFEFFKLKAEKSIRLVRRKEFIVSGTAFTVAGMALAVLALILGLK